MRDHVAAAKQLLEELDQHATAITQAIGRDAGAEVLAAVEQRGRLLAQFDELTQTMARASSWQARTELPGFNELLGAATAAQESQDRLLDRARGERDRLAKNVARPRRPDAVADRYAATGQSGHRTISLAG